MDQELKEISPKGSDNSRSSETLIAIEANDFAGANGKSNESIPNKAAVMDDEAAKMEREDACSIDIDFMGENQSICRICHLNAKESGKSGLKLMELGCGCKGELGVAHLHCAEAWFRVKGNRLCEICGKVARNITGISDNGFMEEWNERSMMDGNNSTSDERRRCPNRHPLCNLLMSCLFIAFVLPWL